MPHETTTLEFTRLTPDGRHHFFGYYDKFPWDATGRYVLGLEPRFIDRMPEPGDSVAIGMVDTGDGNRWIEIDRTHAWNWQQGTMLHWLPADEGGQQSIIYNRRAVDRFVSVVRDPFGEGERELSRPVYCLRPDGKQALSANFSRIAHTRPGYGYEGIPDRGFDTLAPSDDGIWTVDLRTGESRLIVTIRQMAGLSPHPDFAEGKHWFNHVQYAPDGERFVFLHRWGQDGGIRWGTRMLTARPDGSDVRILADDGMTSHFDWRDPGHIFAWARHRERGDHYYLFDDRTGESELVGADVLPADGHCSFRPALGGELASDERWILTDQYPDETRHRALILYRPSTNRRIDIGKFYAPPELDGPTRCDLHPRWSRDGRSVCIDSVHEGTRGMYVADVSGIVA